MTIKELNNYPKEWIVTEIKNGGRFVVFPYCISIIIMSFVRHSSESAIKHSWIYIIISCVLGLWGIPWGLIYTIKSIYTCFHGEDCTPEVVGQDPYLSYVIYQEPWDHALSRSN